MKIDLSPLRPVDIVHMRNILTTSGIPDGIKRFCMSAVFKDNPMYNRLHQQIHDADDTMGFIEDVCCRWATDFSFARYSGLTIGSNNNFGQWFSLLVLHNVQLLPDHPTKTKLIEAIGLVDAAITGVHPEHAQPDRTAN